jgi:hypothetical protein
LGGALLFGRGFPNWDRGFAAGFLLMPFSSTISACYDVRWPSTRSALQPNRGFIAAAAFIGLAASCWSFLCLLIGSVVGNAATVVLLIACRRDLGIFRPSLKGCRDVIGFGAYSCAVAVINVIYQSFPQLVLGRILDFTAVALYSRATGAPQLLDRLFLGVLGPVIMPAVVAQTMAGADLKRLYLRAVELSTATQWPFLTYHGADGRADCSDLVRHWVDRGCPSCPDAVPGFPRLIRGASDLSGAGRGQPGRRCSHIIFDLAPAVVAGDLFRVRFWWGVVDASAFLTMPFQAVAATYFIRRHLAFNGADLVGRWQRAPWSQPAVAPA